MSVFLLFASLYYYAVCFPLKGKAKDIIIHISYEISRYQIVLSIQSLYFAPKTPFSEFNTYKLQTA